MEPTSTETSAPIPTCGTYGENHDSNEYQERRRTETVWNSIVDDFTSGAFRQTVDPRNVVRNAGQFALSGSFYPVMIRGRTTAQSVRWSSLRATDPFETRAFRPGRIDRLLRPGHRFSRQLDIGTVSDGDWDQYTRSVCEDPTYRGLVERFDEGCAWEDTAYYEYAKERIAERGTYMGYENLESFLAERCAYVDRLFERIDANGYKPQSELEPSDVDTTRVTSASIAHHKTHEVGVTIDRLGEPLLHHGYHRLAIADVLDIERIPTIVVARHSQWQRIRDLVYDANTTHDLPTNVQSVLDHPDMQGVRPPS